MEKMDQAFDHRVQTNLKDSRSKYSEHEREVITTLFREKYMMEIWALRIAKSKREGTEHWSNKTKVKDIVIEALNSRSEN